MISDPSARPNKSTLRCKSRWSLHIIFTCSLLSCDDGSNVHVLMLVLLRTTECRGSYHTSLSGAQNKPTTMIEALQAVIWHYVSSLVGPLFFWSQQSKLSSHVSTSQHGATSPIQLTTIKSVSDNANAFLRMQRTRYIPRRTRTHSLLESKADACSTPWGTNLLCHRCILLCPHNNLHNLGYVPHIHTLPTRKEGLMDERKSHSKTACAIDWTERISIR